MAKQRGGNRGILITVVTLLVITGIIIGILYGVGVLGKKPTVPPVTPTGHSSNFVPPTGHGSSGSLTDVPVIKNVNASGSHSNQLQLEVEYVSSSSDITNLSPYIQFGINVVPPPNSYWMTSYEASSSSISKIGEGLYSSTFNIAIDPKIPPSTYSGSVSIILCQTCKYSKEFSFQFRID